MEVSCIRASGLKNSILEHPYLFAALFCIVYEIFTFGDQLYIGAVCIMLTMLVLGGALVFMLKKSGIKINTAMSAGIIIAFMAVGAMISGSSRKGPAVCLAVIMASLSVMLALYRKRQLTADRMTAIVIFLSFGICAAYVLYTYSTFRQTDVGGWDAPVGHAGYVKYFFDHSFSLPDFDPRERSQFYHTPLYYLSSAFLAKLVSFFGVETVQAFEISQVLSLFCSYCIVITSCRIFRLFGLKDWSMTTAAAVVSMCNALVMMAGSVSNDTMAAALEVGALYCAMKWSDSRKLLDIIKTALCLGFGIMAKLSAWMAAPAIAFLFIFAFFKTLRKKQETFRTLGQFVLFLLVSVPLAIWHPVYNLLRFGIPLGYIPEGVYDVADRPVFERLFTIGPKAFTSPVVNPLTFNDEYNPFFTLFKSTLDLQRLSKYDSLMTVLSFSLICSVILGLAAFVVMIGSILIKHKTLPVQKNIAIVIFYFTMMISFIVFCLKYPFIVTENVRYIYPVIMIGALYCGVLAGHKFKSEKTQAVQKVLLAVTGLYGFCFVATFGFLGFIQ